MLHAFEDCDLIFMTNNDYEIWIFLDKFWINFWPREMVFETVHEMIFKPYKKKLSKPLKENTNWIGKSYQNGFEIIFLQRLKLKSFNFWKTSMIDHCDLSWIVLQSKWCCTYLLDTTDHLFVEMGDHLLNNHCNVIYILSNLIGYFLQACHLELL
jgi:hypothetical protein